MELIHTLLFLLRENSLQADVAKAEKCLKSLEKSSYKKVIVYNQGFWSNERLQSYLQSFQLECVIIGNGANVGIVAGRQSCFEYIWAHVQNIAFISELHLDMIFTSHWENPLVDYLSAHDEPMVCCGIVSRTGQMPGLNISVQPPPGDLTLLEEYLNRLKRDEIAKGITHPCIHKLDILKAVGGYDRRFMIGKQAFEDDSLFDQLSLLLRNEGELVAKNKLPVHGLS